MKIVHIVLGKANPQRMNGVNKIVHQLASFQVASGQDAIVIGLTKSNVCLEKRDYPLLIFKQNPYSFKMIQELKSFFKSLSSHSIIHFHGTLIPVYSSIGKYLKQRQIPYVVTPHGALQPMALRQKKLIKMIFFFLFEKYFLDHAKAVQAITPYEYKEIKKMTKARVKLIPNAYPYYSIPIKEFENSEITFGYLGRLDKNHKGLDALIDGFNRFYSKNQQGYLYLIGNGKDRKWLERKNKIYGLAKRVFFTGEVYGEQKQQFINQVDVFVSPSRWDVLPTSILETCANAKPCIVTAATGFGKNIQKYDAGFVLTETLPALIDQGMNASYDDFMGKRLNDKGLNAQNMVKEEYNWSKIGNKILSKIYGYNHD